MSDRLHEQFGTIAVATDFSNGAEAATKWGMGIARGHGAQLVLVHVIASDLASMMTPDVRESVESRLRAEESKIRDEGIDVTSVCSVGRAWEMVVEEAASRSADLVIVGARGRTAYSRFFLGSTADRIIRTAASPVLTVHIGDEAHHRKTLTILVPYDFSTEAKEALEAAVRLQHQQVGEHKIVLMHACHAPVEYAATAAAAVITGHFAEMQRDAQKRLDELADTLRAPHLAVETVVSGGYAASAIEAVAADVGADLIAMGTLGRSGINKLLLGSIAERVLHHASCPVLTVNHAVTSARPESLQAATS